MEYSSRIKDLKCPIPKDADINQQLYMKFGHKEALKEAAEIALEADNELENTREKLISLTVSYLQKSMEVNTLTAKMPNPDLDYRYTATFDEDTVAVMGLDRIKAIIHVIDGSIQNQINTSYNVAMSGALRWPITLRPEVLVDAYGSLL